MAMDLENIMQDTIVIEARFREKKGDRHVQCMCRSDLDTLRARMICIIVLTIYTVMKTR